MFYLLFGTIKIPVVKSPLTFVVTMMLTLFLVAIAVLGTTASGRQTSSRYIYFAGLYDLALAANQRAFYLLDKEEQIISYLQEKYFDEYLMYIEEDFIRDVKREYLADFLQQNFGTRGEYFYFSYRLAVSSGTYYVRTYILQRPAAFELRSEASKEVNGHAEIPVRVYARIEWPYITDVKFDEFGMHLSNELQSQLLRVRRVAN